MSRLPGLLLSFVLVSAHAQVPALPTGWKHYQELGLEQTGLLKIALPIETVGHSQMGLEDLRILGTNMQEVPFRMQTPRKAEARSVQAKQMTSKVEEKATLIEIETGLKEPIRGLEFVIPKREFFKAITVKITGDGGSWQTVAQKKPFYRSGTSRQDTIELPEGIWQRITVEVDDSKSDPVPFEAALLLTPPQDLNPPQVMEGTIMQRQEIKDQSRVQVKLPVSNLYLAGVEIVTPEPLFRREVSLTIPRIHQMEIVPMLVASGEVGKYMADNGTVREERSLEVESRINADEFSINISNGDAPPLAVEKVRVFYRPDHVAFYNPGRAGYFIVTGNSRAESPRYETGLDEKTVERAPVAKASLGPLLPNPNYKEPETLPGLAEEGAPIDLSDWKYRKQVTVTTPGVQELELDLETLSLIRHRSELRLVAEGKQWPFLSSTPGNERELSPVFTPANDPERPTVSIWQIRLPFGSLPVRRLECVVITPVFQRGVTLYEVRPGLRSQTEKRLIGQGNWSRRAGESKERFTVEFSAVPEGDNFWLEIQNGDNPPLKLQSMSVYYPVTKLIFKATEKKPLYLYLGNPKAHEPTYDLAIAGSELLRSERKQASLGQVQILKGERGNLLGTKGTPIFFWAVLLVVVGALVFVIAKLLPAKAEG